MGGYFSPGPTDRPWVSEDGRIQAPKEVITTQDALRPKFYRAPALLAKTADSIEKETFLAMANALYSTDFVVSQI